MILDTQYLGELATQDPDARELAREIKTSSAPRRIPSAVVWELVYGLGKISDERRAVEIRQTYEMLLRSGIVLESDGNVARRA